MSKLTEYLKLLPRAIANIDKVIEGHINKVKLENGTLPDHEVEIIVGRRLICEQCPFNSKNAVAMGLHKTSRTDEYCIHCGCELLAKTASLLSNCGLEAYNSKSENKDNPLPLKWEKVTI